ncbi:MAG: polysaccharide biosynthesis/export family protein [Gemmatimonadota bacterium]|nr:polysaccharide biosynthesis/export family protein [Gemmatimonadota bacterium]
MTTLRLIPFLFLAFALAAQSGRAQSTAPTEAFSLGEGDVVRVKIWREKDLDGDYQVDESGRITLPLVGARRVTGIPWSVLRDSLLDAYRRELKAPSVSLVPLRRVFVLGEVTKPGPYLADPTLNLAGIIALAGGASPLGDLGKLRIVRHGQVIARGAALDGASVPDIRSGDEIFVDQRSWFDRNSTFVASAAISVASIIITLVRR